MKIQNIEFQISDYPVSDFILTSADISDGICQIPSMCIEVEIKIERSHFWRSEAASLRGLPASLHVQDTAENTRSYAGVIHSVEARIGQNGSLHVLRLHLSGWPRTPQSHSVGYRFFQDKTAVEIATEIFSSKNTSVELPSKLKDVNKRPYQVQYAESDQSFVSRLLLREQLLFRVGTQHDRNNTSMQAVLHVYRDLTDLPSDPAPIEFSSTHTETVGLKPGFYNASVRYPTAPDVLSRASYSTQHSNLDLRVTTQENFRSDGQWIELETNDFFDNRTEGQSRVEHQLRALRAQRYSLGCDLLRVSAGTIYTVTGFASDSKVSTQLAIVASRQVFKKEVMTGNWLLEGVFEAAAPEFPFVRQAPPSPVLPGLLRGVVVAQRGNGLEPSYAQLGNDDMVDTEQFGRVRVRILWHGDVRADTSPSTDAPWLRVMTPWAGHRAGFFALPRAGQEVMVSFINGDPEQPVVMGSLYGESHSGASTPPWSMPDAAKWVGIGTRSSSGTQQFFRLDATDPKANGVETNEGVELYSASQMRIDAAKNINVNAPDVDFGKNTTVKNFTINSQQITSSSSTNKTTTTADDWVDKVRNKTRTQYTTSYTGKMETMVGGQSTLLGTSIQLSGLVSTSTILSNLNYAVATNFSYLNTNNAKYKMDNFLYAAENVTFQEVRAAVAATFANAMVGITEHTANIGRAMIAAHDMNIIL